MDDLNQEIDVSHAERRIWLLPDFLYTHWSAQQTDDVELGSVRIYEQTSGSPTRVTFHLSSNSHTAHLPQEYDMVFLKQSKANNIFSEEQNSAIAIEGKIEHECHLRPSSVNQAYRDVIKARNLHFNKPKRTLQLIDSIKEGVGASFMRPLPQSVVLTGGRRKIPVELRRERLPKEALLDFLFTAFEKFKYWNFKDILEYTKQPSNYLKEVLAEICDLNKRGDFKGCYQLKAEYLNANRSGAATAIAPSISRPIASESTGAATGHPEHEMADEDYDDEGEEDEDTDPDDIEMEDVTPY
ncbi:hypothetical protein DI09_37p200 [Mitosporidium daphniae]|uniref:Transcription initiation factor IIF subunit beta n=1 Tax=Mitosporidium daphniae TaxID=1485682 RepID=A0A098VQU1_9MICR|nr:uncharacterized protein DI09_37p200 [Mitosporidium daphniae]KGG51383.1 hypothetical protein DI09_37p200 [Mitosporidium daphniae]|eukprot:XP_013237810.1 uncharacterized protein DI09_37p200 [Mitosporidium daphniae]